MSDGSSSGDEVQYDYGDTVTIISDSEIDSQESNSESDHLFTTNPLPTPPPPNPAQIPSASAPAPAADKGKGRESDNGGAAASASPTSVEGESSQLEESAARTRTKEALAPLQNIDSATLSSLVELDPQGVSNLSTTTKLMKAITLLQTNFQSPRPSLFDVLS
ncbi:hypothetical protein P7C70_g9584, partial [Phenoliferia sp. Uapishka_3]